MTARVLVVEDEPVLRTAMRVSLAGAGFEVVEAADAKTALTGMTRDTPDAVLLDLGLPDMDGLELLGCLREHSAVGIVVVTARDDRLTTIAALDAGADDFLTKPFHTDILLARLRAVLRRGTTSATGLTPLLVRTGDVEIDLAARSVTRGGARVPLTRTELRLLEALVTHPGVLRSHRELLEEVWGPAYTEETTYLRTFIRQLRAKLGDDAEHPRYLATEQGIGYRWVAPAG